MDKWLRTEVMLMTLFVRLNTITVLGLVTAFGCGDDGTSSGRLDTSAGGVMAGMTAGVNAGTPAAGVTGGVQTVAGTTAGTPVAGTTAGTPVAGTTAGTPVAGTTAVTPAACGNDPSAAGDPGCPVGLSCGNPTGTGGVCLCPATTTLPACTAGGTECDAFPGTSCLMAAGSLGCLLACTPPGQMATACPTGTACADTFGMGAFCAEPAGLPPVCTLPAGDECAAFPGTFCMNLGVTGCFLSCVL